MSSTCPDAAADRCGDGDRILPVCGKPVFFDATGWGEVVDDCENFLNHDLLDLIDFEDI